MKCNISGWLGLLAIACVSGLLLAGCAWSIGESKDGKTYVQPTRGAELSDLKKARDQGAISEDEYQAQRAKILGK